MPRLRAFAGPNGSGKSTLLADMQPEWVGIYVNADNLYFIGTDDVAINIDRVHQRVDLAGMRLTKARSGSGTKNRSHCCVPRAMLLTDLWQDFRD